MHVERPLLGQHRLHQQQLVCGHWAVQRAVRQVPQPATIRQPYASNVLQPATAVAASSPEVALNHTTATSSASAIHSHVQQRQTPRKSSKHKHKDKGRRNSDTYTGRLLFKYPAQSFLAMPASLQELRRTTAVATIPSPNNNSSSTTSHEQQWSQSHAQLPEQPQHSQVQQPAASLQVQNKRFSYNLKQVVNVQQWLLLLEDSSLCGTGLGDLDGVSVVGALLWLVKNRDWKQGTAGWQWHTRQGVQQAVEALLNRAEVLVGLQGGSSTSVSQPPGQQPSSAAVHSSSGSSHAQTAAAAAAWSVPLFRPQDLASLIYLTSKLKQRRPQLLAAAAAALTQDLYACNPVELNRIIWGLADARVYPGDTWLLNFCKSCQSKFFLSSGAHLPVMVYGLARLKYRPSDVWIAAWLEAAEPQLTTFSPQGLCNAAWGLAQWRFQAPDHWLTSFYAASQRVMSQLEATGISQMQLGLVTLAASNPPPQEWMQQMVKTAEPLFSSMELLQLCNFGWGLAQWGHRPPLEVMRSYMAAVESHLVTATPTDLSTMLWICNKLLFVPDQTWLNTWFASAQASLPRCEPQHLTTIALVLGNWGVRPKRDFMMDFWGCSKARFKDFTAYQVGLLVWGLGKARHTLPQTWTSALLTTFSEHLLHEAEATDIARLIGGLASVRVITGEDKPWVISNRGVQQQLQGLCEWVQPQISELLPCWLVVLLKGLYKLRLPLDRDVVQSLTTAAAQLDERLKPEQRKYLLLTLEKLSRRAGSAAAFAERLQQQQQLDDGGLDSL